jgi:hypothetical protein
LSYDGSGNRVSAFELISPGGLFDPTKVDEDVVVGPFDIFTSFKFVKLVHGGVENVAIGPVLAAGLTAETLLSDMEVDGWFPSRWARSMNSICTSFRNPQASPWRAAA